MGILQSGRLSRRVALVGLVALLLLFCAGCQKAEEAGEGLASPGPEDGTALALAQEDEERLSVVWEVWGKLEEAYPDQGILDRERAVEGAILAMLSTVEQGPYPFLTELDTVVAEPPEEVPTGLTDIWRSWLLLRQRNTDVSPEEMVQAAARGLTVGLDDPHAGYMTQEQYAEVLVDRTGEYEGIGAYVGMVDGRVTITGPIPGGPAEALGLRADDVIAVVEGESVEGLSLAEVVERIKGPQGSLVRLQIQRPGEEELLPFVITRGLVDVPSVEMQELPLKVRYIYISEFADDTGEEFERALREALDEGMEGLVLDLRGNPGGSISPAVQIAGQFLDGGLAMYELDGDEQRKDWPVAPGGLAVEIPLAVIVNQFTASASEVVAGALQDRGRARLFGQQTYGKGAVQVYRELSDGSAVRVTRDYWYTPSGQQFHGQGITPDEEVSFGQRARILRVASEGVILALDSQLEAAYTHVLSLYGRSSTDLPRSESTWV